MEVEFLDSVSAFGSCLPSWSDRFLETAGYFQAFVFDPLIVISSELIHEHLATSDSQGMLEKKKNPAWTSSQYVPTTGAVTWLSASCVLSHSS